jgi:hypothetical protein
MKEIVGTWNQCATVLNQLTLESESCHSLIIRPFSEMLDMRKFRVDGSK